MNKEEIEKQLKLSKRQTKDERYDYLDSEFNAINYCIKLEKYTNKLQQENQSLKKENKILRENAEHNDKVVDKIYWENQKLKKQLEEANEKILLLQASESMLEYKKALEENQQKEFIEWLTNETNINPYDISDYVYEDIINTILSKYYEIIDKLEKGE